MTDILPGVEAEAPASGAHGTGIQGYLDRVTRERLSGWAWCPEYPAKTLMVRVLANDEVIARIVANVHRPDVEAAGFGSGRYGFELTSEFMLPRGACLISVEDDATGLALSNSPMHLEAMPDAAEGLSDATIATVRQRRPTARGKGHRRRER
jgi:hypothetical protein